MSRRRRHSNSDHQQLVELARVAAQRRAQAQKAAIAYLEQRGLTIVARNHRTRFGELDLIAFDEETQLLVFCEITNAAHALLEDVAAKRSHVRRMAAVWLAETPARPQAAELRFDVLAVTLAGDGSSLSIDHLEGAR